MEINVDVTLLQTLIVDFGIMGDNDFSSPIEKTRQQIKKTAQK